MSDERQASEWAEQDFRERLASIKRCIPHMHDVGVLWPRDVEWLIAELERARGDAARYRFLRDNPLQLRAIDGNAGICVASTLLDQRVDSAMSSSPLAPTQEGA